MDPPSVIIIRINSATKNLLLSKKSHKKIKPKLRKIILSQKKSSGRKDKAKKNLVLRSKN